MVKIKFFSDSGIECESYEEAHRLDIQENKREFCQTLLKEAGVSREHENYQEWLNVAWFVFKFDGIFKNVLNNFEFK